MKKKIAVAVDASLHASHAVQYAARIAKVVPELHVVLMHIHPTISGYLLEEARSSATAQKELEKIIEKNQAAASALLAQYQQRLVQDGVPEDRIELKSRPRQIGVADDLLAWCQLADYDALLVGRSGVSLLKGLVIGSVTDNLINYSNLTPIWVVDGLIESDKILLAVDGSPRALRAADHLSFMVSGLEKSRIEMLHVQPSLQDYCAIDLQSESLTGAEAVLLESDRRCLDVFYSQALSVFQRNGFSADRVELSIVANKLSAGRTILEAARQGGFGTIVIGKRGTGKSRFFGSVSRHIIQKAENLAVWIVP